MSVYKFGGESKKKNSKTELKFIKDEYLRRDGSSVATGPLNMGENKISKVVDPGDDQDVATKKYVDEKEITLDESKGKDYILVSGNDRKIVETSAKLADVTRGVSRMLVSKADKLSNSKGPGHFVLTGANGELVESAVKQEKYHQVHTLLQNAIASSAETQTASIQTLLASKADKTRVASVQSALSGKADKTQLTNVQSTLASKADKITDSKGEGHFVLTGANGELVESAVHKEKYNQVHTLLQNQINNLKAIEHSIYVSISSQNLARVDRWPMFEGKGMTARQDITVTHATISFYWIARTSNADKIPNLTYIFKIGDSIKTQQTLQINSNGRMEVPLNVNVKQGDVYHLNMTLNRPSPLKKVTCRLWYKHD